MAITYTSSDNSILGSDYCAGLVSGVEEYIIMPIDSNTTVVLQGEFSKAVSGNNISFEGERWIVSRDSNSYSSYYHTEYTPNTECTVNITEPYYCRGSLNDMSVIASRRDGVTANFATIAILWGVLICVALWELLRSCVRSR